MSFEQDVSFAAENANLKSIKKACQKLLNVYCVVIKPKLKNLTPLRNT